jgi:hypothetical protein
MNLDPRYEAVLLASMDPNPVNLSHVDEYHVARARNAIKRAQRNGKASGLQEPVRRK